MSLEITGIIHRIGAVTSKQVGEKTYREQEVIIETTDEHNGGAYRSYPALLAKMDKVIGYVSGMKVGQKVTAKFNLRGVMYTKDGNERNFTKAEMYSIQAVNGTSQPAANPGGYAAPEQPQAVHDRYSGTGTTAVVDELPF